MTPLSSSSSSSSSSLPLYPHITRSLLISSIVFSTFLLLSFLSFFILYHFFFLFVWNISLSICILRPTLSISQFLLSLCCISASTFYFPSLFPPALCCHHSPLPFLFLHHVLGQQGEKNNNNGTEAIGNSKVQDKEMYKVNTEVNVVCGGFFNLIFN